jgi:carboxymethylenebutenolidase
MAIKTDWVRYGEGLGYLAWPEFAKKPLPAVLVIQEVYGVDEHIQDVARRFAGAGYAALAPDLYAHDGARPPALTAERIAQTQSFIKGLPPGSWLDPKVRETELSNLQEPHQANIRETFTTLFAGIGSGGMQLDKYVSPLKESLRFLHNDCAVSRGQKAACVGFCMGGSLSALLACHDEDLSGAVMFYGSSPAADLIPKIACPVLGFYGGLDTRVNATLPGLAQAMKNAGKMFVHHTYEGAHHGFFNDGRQSYNADAARGAFVRTLAFFEQTLVNGSGVE